MSARIQVPRLFIRKIRGFSFPDPSTCDPASSCCRLHIPKLASKIILLTALLCLPVLSHSQTPDAEIDAGNRAFIAQTVYTDDIGRKVALPSHPSRIISLAPSITETLYMLGAEGQLIGVTDQSDWPESAKLKPRIGDLLNPNFEIILNAKPDLIIASTAGNDRAAVMKLAGFGLPVFVTAPRSVEKIFESILTIGRITGRESEGKQLVSRLKARLEAVKLRLAGMPATRAFFITWFDPLLAPGKNTFENDVLLLANAISITAEVDEFYPRFSLEEVLALDPDVILTVVHPGNPLPDLTKLAGWRNLRAVQQGRIYSLNEDLQHPSPRFIDGVEQLAKILYPEQSQ
jgi:iron complex transport system substrate-binding protein